MAKHHIVQAKYLSQWNNHNNLLDIYIIKENRIIQKGPNWRNFWRKDYNILDEEEGKSYLPEEVTSIIDTKGLDAIKRIDPSTKPQLTAQDRSAISFYVVLQYIRTPRYREETDKLINAATKHYMSQDISSPDKVRISKEELLQHVPQNDEEKDTLQEIKKMSDAEIKQMVYEMVQGGEVGFFLTTTGHSKGILKVHQYAEELFEKQYLFLVAPRGHSFITSDNPCFIISDTKVQGGLLSPQSRVIFPLRPDLCIFISPNLASKVEQYLTLEPDAVDEINQLTLTHANRTIVANDIKQLENLTRDYDHSKHRPVRDIKIVQKGDYTAFLFE